MKKLKDLKTQGTDRSKVMEWLAINEPDEDSRKEVMELCATNAEYRKWFVEEYCK